MLARFRATLGRARLYVKIEKTSVRYRLRECVLKAIQKTKCSIVLAQTGFCRKPGRTSSFPFEFRTGQSGKPNQRSAKTSQVLDEYECELAFTAQPAVLFRKFCLLAGGWWPDGRGHPLLQLGKHPARTD